MIEQQGENGIVVSLSDAFFAGGDLGVRIWRRVDPETRRLARVTPQGYLEWNEIPNQHLIDGVTFQIPHEIARSVLEALLRYYQGASDMHTVRADLLHERTRVDRLIGMYGDLAEKAIDA